jgi:flavin-dependent dehydrogenase
VDRKWDLIVAGAGPAGCTLAAKVATGGYNVLLIERSGFPGDGRSWIVDVERTVFSEAGVPRPCQEASWYEPERQLIMSAKGKSVELLESPVLPVRNREYVRQLAHWAMESGAEVVTGSTVLGPVLDGHLVTGVTYSRDGDTARANGRLVADCTGLPGAIRKNTPADWFLDGDISARDLVLARREVRRIDVGAAREAVAGGVVLDRKRLDRTAVMSPYSVFTYYMDLERGEIDILVGGKLGGRYPTAEEWFSRILGRWPFVKETLFGDGAAIPVRRTWDALVGDGLLVAGDAACQVIPVHGSGTASALIAANLASQSVIRALEGKSYDRSALWDYCHQFQSGRGSVLAYYYVIQRHTDSLDPADIDKMMEKGIISASDVHNGLLPAPFKKNPLDLARKLARGISSLHLMAGFAAAGLKSERMMKHYRRYPERYSRHALDSWRRGLPSS